MAPTNERRVIEVYEVAVLSDGSLAWIRRSPTGEKLPVELERLEVVFMQGLAHCQRELIAARTLVMAAQSQRRVVG